MVELFLLICAVLAFDGVILGALAWAYSSPRFAAHRIHLGAEMMVPWAARARTMTFIGVLSVVAIFGALYALYEHLLHDRPTAWWLVVLQSAAVLLLYDFIYYFAHRVMHHKRVLKLVHGVHHRARNPSVLESFYLHPIELFVGLSLLLLATWILGPVHIHAFALAFFVYSTLNILVHSGLDSKSALLSPIDFLAKKHLVHHLEDPTKNFSSLTPLPDLLFGTRG